MEPVPGAVPQRYSSSSSFSLPERPPGLHLFAPKKKAPLPCQTTHVLALPSHLAQASFSFRLLPSLSHSVVEVHSSPPKSGPRWPGNIARACWGPGEPAQRLASLVHRPVIFNRSSRFLYTVPEGVDCDFFSFCCLARPPFVVVVVVSWAAWTVTQNLDATAVLSQRFNVEWVYFDAQSLSTGQ